LKLKCDEPLSNCAFKFNLRRYTKTLRSKLRVFEWASVVYTSALTGQRIQKVLSAAAEAGAYTRPLLGSSEARFVGST